MSVRDEKRLGTFRLSPGAYLAPVQNWTRLLNSQWRRLIFVPVTVARNRLANKAQLNLLSIPVRHSRNSRRMMVGLKTNWICRLSKPQVAPV